MRTLGHALSQLHRLVSPQQPEAEVELEGWISPFQWEEASSYFALIPEMPCCVGCLPREAACRVEVLAAEVIEVTGQRVRLRGRLHWLDNDAAGWRYQLRDARLATPGPDEDTRFHRRHVLQALAALGAAATRLPAFASTAEMPSPSAAPAEEPAREALKNAPTIDIHSHDGRIIGLRNVQEQRPFTPVGDAMREGGLAVMCAAIVSDTPTHHITPDHRIQAFREPEPGELQAYAERSFARVHELVRAQQFAIVRSVEDLRAARSELPGLIIAAEGGDFLEGQPERVDDAYDRWALRHLQLTHYRVNELGDIQTEPPVHNGLTRVGAEVVRRCNRLGIVVDVAHATLPMVKQAAEVTTRPLVLSHTSLGARPGPRSRLITAEHARVIADTGGVIGIWPPASIFHDLNGLSAGIARMVDAIGIDHVGLGSDMRGLVGPSVLDTYRDLPKLAQALLARGFGPQDVRQILGGNYLRVFEQTVGDGRRPWQQHDEHAQASSKPPVDRAPVGLGHPS